MVSVLALIASHNRKPITLECISALLKSSTSAGISLGVVLVDASSTDGTASAVASRFPEVQVIQAPGSSYWASSMRIGWESTQNVDRDYLLWLNDDVVLDPNAVQDLIHCANFVGEPSIVVGSTRDTEGARVTYGGYVRGPWFKRLSLKRVSTSSRINFVELANGNILLVSDFIDRGLGGFPKGFSHSMADLAFTNLARSQGVPIALAPGTQGTCDDNPVRGTWRDSNLDAVARVQKLWSPKGLPFMEWARICLRIGGISAPLYLFSPLIRALLGRLS